MRSSEAGGVSSGSIADASAAVGSSGESRPSLFSGVSESFSPFGAVNRIGALGGVSSGVSSGGDSVLSFDSPGQC